MRRASVAKGWQELLDEIAADLGERGARVMADVAFWIEHERFDPAERAPLSAALERAERLATFFSNRLLDEDLARRSAWHAGHAQASALRLALQALMAQGDDRIGPEMLNKLVAQASGRGSGNPLLDAQAGALPSVTDPAAVVEPFDEVTWWQLAAGPIPAPYVWSKSEIESLRAAGVELPEIPSLLERQARGALRPLLLARERLTLVLPPPGQEVHPVWLLVEGLLDKNLPIEPVESVLAAGPVDGITPVKHETLPALRRWWQLPGGTVVPWPAKVSYSSLQPLFFNPYQWLLRYPARLQASALLNMPNDFRLLGQLAHRAVERLYGHAGSLGWTTEQVAHWFDQNLDAIVDEEGAVLRMPGKRSELEGFRLRFRASLLRLHAHLQTAKVEQVESEKEFEAETALGLLHGSTDLLLSFGGSREAVIDMKWAGTSKYRKVLEQGSHLQLAVYAFLQERASKRWPAVGYYILREGDLLTPAENLFPDARLVSQAEGATAALWEQAKATWRWRRAQIDKGAVELVVDGTEATDESAPPAGRDGHRAARRTLQPLRPPCGLGVWPMSAHIRFISAGAGSGKTYRLTELLLAELQAGRVRPAGVLATTFTKRAATELRERVRGFLISQGEFTRADAVGSARIGTVNSVCGSLLQRFAFEAGLPTEQRVLDEARAGQLLREAVDTVIEGHALSELLQVARRLSLDADPRGGKPPWQDALGKLVDQARANAIDADVLRGIRHGQRRQPALALSGACQDGSRCTPGRRAGGGDSGRDAVAAGQRAKEHERVSRPAGLGAARPGAAHARVVSLEQADGVRLCQSQDAGRAGDGSGRDAGQPRRAAR
jgi:hypothetical protein